jgi:hypothetical protein
VSRLHPRLRAALPGLLAALLLGFVLWRVDPRAVVQALASARWGRYLAVASAFTGVWLALDSLVLARLVSRFHRPLSVRQVLPLRGASYLLMALSYDAAQAGLGLALHRRYDIPLLAIGGTYLFYYLIDLTTIGLLGSAGAQALPGALGEALRIALGALLAGVLLAFGLLARWARSPSERVPQPLRGTRLLATLRRARPRDVAEFLAWRATFYLSFVAFVACSLPAFGIRVPLPDLAALVPLVMSVSALPVTVAGLGSTQLAMWMLYRPYADPAAILAYSVVYSATLVLFRMPIALACLPAASDVLARRERPIAA